MNSTNKTVITGFSLERISLLFCLLPLICCDFAFQTPPLRPDELPPPFFLGEGAKDVTAGRSRTGMSWLHYSTPMEGGEFYRVVAERLGAAGWERESIDWLDTWHVFSPNQRDLQLQTEALKSIWRSPAGLIFTFNLERPLVVHSNEQPTLRVEMMLYPPDEGSDFVTRMRGMEGLFEGSGETVASGPT